MKIRINKDGVIVVLCAIIAVLSGVIVSLSSRNGNDARMTSAGDAPPLAGPAAAEAGEIIPSTPPVASEPVPQDESSTAAKAPPLPPDEVIALIDGMDLGREMEQACAEFAVRMAQEDPQKGWDWVNSLKVPAAFDRAVFAFGSALSSSNPDYIWKIIDKSNANPRQVRLMEAFNSGTAVRDLDESIRNLERLGTDASPQLTAACRRGLIRGALTNPQPEKILDIFVATPPSENVDTHVGGNLLIQIALVNKSKVNEAILGMAQNDYNASLVEYYMNQMSGTDPNAAGEFVNSMPDGMIKDRATGRVVNSLLNQDPDSAIQWAHSIRDNATRSKTYEGLYIYFKTQNPPTVDPSVIAPFLAPGVKDRVDGDVYQTR